MARDAIYKYLFMYYTGHMKENQTQLQAKLFKGFADRSRLLILTSVLAKPKTVSEIVGITKLSQPNTSAHLACLLECGLLQRAKKGREVFYSISGKEVPTILREVRKVLKKHSEKIKKCKSY